MLTQKYQKQTLIGLTRIPSEALSQNEQSYEIKYYEKTPKFTDKIFIYIYYNPIKDTDKEYAIRSISFLDPEQLKKFIQDTIHSYLFFIEKRLSETLPIPLSEYRTILLESFLKSIRDEQLKRWKNGDKTSNNAKVNN